MVIERTIRQVDGQGPERAKPAPHVVDAERGDAMDSELGRDESRRLVLVADPACPTIATGHPSPGVAPEGRNRVK